MSAGVASIVQRYLFAAMWLAWLLYWAVAAAGAKTTLRREAPLSRLGYVIPLCLAGLLFTRTQWPWAFLGERFLPGGAAPFWIGALLTAGGLLFTVWARIHLGRNWSGTVTIKEDHELVTSGPYALVRHPIYTGLMLAFVGSAVALGQWRGVAAALLAILAFWKKLRIEERWLGQEFGDAYATYRKRVAALIPYVL
jgi:protein-S-isoprenylcysteine O-methyltransferase Ste14